MYLGCSMISLYLSKGVKNVFPLSLILLFSIIILRSLKRGFIFRAILKAEASISSLKTAIKHLPFPFQDFSPHSLLVTFLEKATDSLKLQINIQSGQWNNRGQIAKSPLNCGSFENFRSPKNMYKIKKAHLIGELRITLYKSRLFLTSGKKLSPSIAVVLFIIREKIIYKTKAHSEVKKTME